MGSRTRPISIPHRANTGGPFYPVRRSRLACTALTDLRERSLGELGGRCGVRLQPPATIRTISRRSPGLRARSKNSEGATASPLCSTTTLLGSNPRRTRNCSMVVGNSVGTVSPLAITDIPRACWHGHGSKAGGDCPEDRHSGQPRLDPLVSRSLPSIFRFGLPHSGTTFSPCRRIPSFPSTFPESPR